MKAWGSRGSGYEVLEVPPPAVASPGSCVVRMAAVGLNPTDWKHVGNNMHYITMTKATPENPVILGMEGAGIIESVSQGETKFQVGQKVWFMASKACTELVEVRNEQMAIAPTQMSMEEAGSAPLALLTAYQSMKDAGFSEPGSGKGKRILVHAGAGGVGHFALQLAKIYQFDEIVTTCSSANADFVKSMGATSMVDYRNEDFVTKFANAKFDVAFDPVGGEPVGCCCAARNALAQYTPRSRKVTKVGGTVIGIITEFFQLCVAPACRRCAPTNAPTPVDWDPSSWVPSCCGWARRVATSSSWLAGWMATCSARRSRRSSASRMRPRPYWL